MLLMLAALGVMAAMDRLFRYPVRGLHDVIELARPANDEEFERLLDPEWEARLRAQMSAAEFREEQRIRIHKLFDCIRHRSFNAGLITRFAYREWKRRAGQTETAEEKAQLFLVREVIEAAAQLRIYCVAALPTLAFWILLRADRWPLIIPRISELREIARVDGLQAYYRLTTAIGYLSLFYGERSYDSLMMKLHGGIPKE